MIEDLKTLAEIIRDEIDTFGNDPDCLDGYNAHDAYESALWWARKMVLDLIAKHEVQE